MVRLDGICCAASPWGLQDCLPVHRPPPPHRRAKHVVVIVFDGFRPDSVTESDMPTLFRLAHEGTTFAHHHPVYLSSTEVNGTALATGAFPRHSGVMANDEYRPDLELLKPFGTQDLEVVRKGDAKSGGMYLRMPTVAEQARAAGLRTAIAGTKPVALLLDRRSAMHPANQRRRTLSCSAGRRCRPVKPATFVRRWGRCRPLPTRPGTPIAFKISGRQTC